MEKRMLVIFLILIQLTGMLFAQNFVNVYSNDPELEYVVERIDFLDENTKEVINSFDVEEHNTFKYLDSYLTRISSNHVKYYDLRDTRFKNLSDLQPNLEGYNLHKFNGNEEVSRVVLLTQVSHPNYHKNHNYTIVTYNLVIYNNETVKGYKSTLYILDKQGNVFKKFENKNFPFIHSAITEDGEHFGFSYGGIEDESLISLLIPSYFIYDLKNDNILYYVNLSNGNVVTWISNIENMLEIRKRMGKNDQLIYFDFEKRKKYSKIYSREERKGLEKITINGLIFKDRFESFESEFIVEDF
jgi:hypothetical protein